MYQERKAANFIRKHEAQLQRIRLKIIHSFDITFFYVI